MSCPYRTRRFKKWHGDLGAFLKHKAKSASNPVISDRRDIFRISEDFATSTDVVRRELRRRGWRLEALAKQMR